MKNREELIRIYTSSNIEAEFVKSQLEENGITCLIKNEYQESINSGFASGILDSADLYIHQEDYEKAEEIINDLQKNPRE